MEFHEDLADAREADDCVDGETARCNVTATSTSAYKLVPNSADIWAECEEADKQQQQQGEQDTADLLRPDYRKMEHALRLKRGLSKASINFPVITMARQKYVNDIHFDGEDDDDDEGSCNGVRAFNDDDDDVAQKDGRLARSAGNKLRNSGSGVINGVGNQLSTFSLPNLNNYPDGFKAFLYKELIETSTLVSLEQEGHLNWWADAGIGPRFYPMVTSGDGNCLLHAASLAMWGFHDRELTLRKLLSTSMKSGSAKDCFKRRWRWQQSVAHKQCGLTLSEHEWDREWQSIIQMACPEPKSVAPTTLTTTDDANDSPSQLAAKRSSTAGKSSNDEPSFESLEEIHVHVLAHVLRRPIIVVSKSFLYGTSGEAIGLIPFGGVYLPLDRNPADCFRSPLMLTFDSAHFSALVWMDDDSSNSSDLTIPVVSPKLELLPVHFAVDPGPNFDWSKVDSEPTTTTTAASGDNLPLMVNGSRRTSVSNDADSHYELLQRYLVIKKVTVGGPANAVAIEGSPNTLPRQNQTVASAATSPDSTPPPKPGSWSGRRHKRNQSMPTITTTVNGFEPSPAGVGNYATLSSSSSRNGLSNDDIVDDRTNVKNGSSSTSSSKGLPEVVLRTVGSLGQNVTRTIRKLTAVGGVGGKRSKKQKLVGTATQSSMATTPVTRLLKPGSQVVCASIVRQRLIYQDELIKNYVSSAEKRFDELQRIRAAQCSELQNKLLPGNLPEPVSSATQATNDVTNQTLKQQTPQSSPSTPFSRQNTLLAPGKSKFYTLSHEQHCLEPPDAVAANAATKTANNASSKITRVGSSCIRGNDDADADVEIDKKSSTASPPSSAKNNGVSVTASDAIVDSSSSSTTVNGTLTKRSEKLNGKSKSHKSRPDGSVGSVSVERKGSRASSNNNDTFAKDKNVVVVNSRYDDNQTLLYDDGVRAVADDHVVCMHAGRPNSEYLCSLCYQAKCYSRIVGYATAVTKF